MTLGMFQNLIPALGLRSEFCDLLPADVAHLPGPLGALGVGGVARGLVLTLLLHLSPTLSHVILGKEQVSFSSILNVLFIFIFIS